MVVIGAEAQGGVGSCGKATSTDLGHFALAPTSVLASATGHVEHRDMTARASFSVHAQIKRHRL